MDTKETAELYVRMQQFAQRVLALVASYDALCVHLFWANVAVFAALYLTSSCCDCIKIRCEAYEHQRMRAHQPGVR